MVAKSQVSKTTNSLEMLSEILPSQELGEYPRVEQGLNWGTREEIEPGMIVKKTSSTAKL